LIFASSFQFSFLCAVAVVNLGLGFAIASRLGWGPALSALLEVGPAALDEDPETAADSGSDGAR
jgi:hypothetical protein